MRSKYVAPSCPIFNSLRPAVKRFNGTTPFCGPTSALLLVRSALMRRVALDAAFDRERTPALTGSVARDRVTLVTLGASAVIVSEVTGMLCTKKCYLHFDVRTLQLMRTIRNIYTKIFWGADIFSSQ